MRRRSLRRLRASRPVVAVLAPALVAAGALGCATSGLPRDAIDAAPIAFLYRSVEEAEQLAEVRDRERRAEERRRDPLRRNVLDLNQLGEAAGLTADAEERAAAALGKVALYRVPDEEVTVMEWAPRGTQPLAWGPDRRRLLYRMLQRGRSHVFEYDLDSGRVRRVTYEDVDHLHAARVPGGGLVVARWAKDDDEGVRLVLLEEGARSSRPLTPGPADSKPVVAPDGSYVIFERLDDRGRHQIARVGLEPGARVQVLARGQDPDLSDDGAWVVYAATLRGQLRLWRMRPDGSGKQRIGPHLVDEPERDPSVSPDGRYVVFVARESERARLMIRPLKGGPTWPLIKEGEGLRPVW